MDSKYTALSGGGSSSQNGFQAKPLTLNNNKTNNNNNYNKNHNFNNKSSDDRIESSSDNNLENSPNKKLKLESNDVTQCNGETYKTNLQSKGSLIEQRKLLPVYSVKDRITQQIINNSTLIIIGETGSGKTTQIPQFLHEYSLINSGSIAITQPRRVAAITIANRVAQEMGCNLGELVGYSVRFEDCTSKLTKIKYLTDGCLLREALSDRLLKAYKYIILDEAHERTINTDVLFGIVKDAQRIRQQKNMTLLKIIIMSATMDVDHFSNYFNNCKTLYLEGRSYPIHVMHAKQPQSDYMLACVSTLFEIHKTAPENHDVLIFLTGQEEIEAMVHQVKSITKSTQIEGPIIRVYPLYSQLSQVKQMEVFNKLPPGTRKVIISTNIAETSLTISGIRYVIDSGVVKRKVFDPITGVESLKVNKISQAQAWQRTGRAGRESEGVCYRTYTLSEFNSLQVNTTPEILKSNISSTILQLLALGIDSQKFNFMDIPPKTSVDNAITTLHLLGAINSIKFPELTSLGQRMARFPLDPRFSKMLLDSIKFNCTEEMLSLVALLSSESIFIIPNERELALAAHSKFESKYGDHLTMLNVYRLFEKTERQKAWCLDNYLSLRNLTYAQKVREQLVEIINRCNMPIISCGNNLDQVRRCLITGLFNNIAELQRDNYYLTLSSRQRAKIHPSSVLQFKPKPPCVIFNELISTGRSYLRCVTEIDSAWIEELISNTGLASRLRSKHYID